MSLLRLPVEIIVAVCTLLPSRDLLALGIVCRATYALFEENGILQYLERLRVGNIITDRVNEESFVKLQKTLQEREKAWNTLKPQLTLSHSILLQPSLFPIQASLGGFVGFDHASSSVQHVFFPSPDQSSSDRGIFLEPEFEILHLGLSTAGLVLGFRLAHDQNLLVLAIR